MFSHIFLYRLKCILRDKENLFWTLLFPIVLAVFFNMALSNLGNAEQFTEIKIAVVDDVAFKEDTTFQEVLKSVSESNVENDSPLFSINYTTKEDAEKLLDDSDIEGYIFMTNKPNLVVKNTGLNQTIIRSFLDNYQQTSSTITTIVSEDPSLLPKVLENVGISNDYLTKISLSSANPNPVVYYFYTLIAMACMFGSFWGLKEVMAVQADLSAQGARVNMAPTHKLKMYAVSLLAATLVQFIIILILILFLVFILKVDFGNNIGYIILTCLVGTITGVSFGAFIGAVVKGSENLKTGILSAGTMLLSFLAGMMYANMKIIIQNNAPIIGYLNPVNLISDSFYSLYYYSTYTQYFINLLILCGLTVVFSIMTYFVLRRQRYASI